MADSLVTVTFIVPADVAGDPARLLAALATVVQRQQYVATKPRPQNEQKLEGLRDLLHSLTTGYTAVDRQTLAGYLRTHGHTLEVREVISDLRDHRAAWLRELQDRVTDLAAPLKLCEWERTYRMPWHELRDLVRQAREEGATADPTLKDDLEAFARAWGEL